MIRLPPRSTQSRSSAASDVYKRQELYTAVLGGDEIIDTLAGKVKVKIAPETQAGSKAVSYTHLRAHETVLDLVCRLLLEKKNKRKKQ